MGIPQEWDTIGVEVADSIATVTLNRPDRMNVMNLTMRDELGTCFDALRLAVEKVRVVVITGAGDAFCAGGDVNDFDGTPAEELHDLMRLRSHRWFQGLWSLPQPTIAAVNGTAAGGGANLVLATDLAIASERARFGETFVRVGLMPDLGGLYLLPRLVGLRKAKELCFTGELIPAAQLAELGLVSRVVPHDELYPETMKLAQNLASKPRHTLALTKMVLNRATEQSMEEVLLNELLGQSYLFGTRDQRDALGTFLHRPERSTSDSEAVDGGR
jgi:enoyl-CoA hydratase/carnithine racemase